MTDQPEALEALTVRELAHGIRNALCVAALVECTTPAEQGALRGAVQRAETLLQEIVLRDVERERRANVPIASPAEIDAFLAAHTRGAVKP